MASGSRASNTPSRGSPLRTSAGPSTNNTIANASLLPQPVSRSAFNQPASFLSRSPPRALPFNSFASFPSSVPPFRPNSRGPPPASSSQAVHNHAGGLTWTTDDALTGDPASEWSIAGLDVPLARISHLVDEADVSTADVPPVRPFSSMSIGAGPSVAAYAFAGEPPRFSFEIIRNAASGQSAPAPPSTSIHDPLLAPPPPAEQTGSLSLYLTCHLVDRDYPASDLTMPATIMLGLREKGARHSDRWLWRKWETFDFTPDREYWQDHSMPSIPALLERHGRGNRIEDLVLSLQISSPTGQAMPEIEGHHIVPRTLLNGIESLLDDPGTGDVLITVCERAPSPTAAHQGDIADGEPSPLYRRRVIYAHSALLKARSSYFDAMLGSEHWLEAGETVAGRRRHRLTISDFSFETCWWLLRWIYTNEVCFVDQPDVRSSSLDELPEGALGSGSNTLGWTWQPLPSTSRRVPSDSERNVFGRVTPTSPAGRTSPVQVLGGFGTTSKRARGKAAETDAPTSPTPSATIVSPTDPHPHPATAPAPTSALDVYRLAHRCELTPLTSLALEHLVATLTPKTAFPLMLISYLWPDLHRAVQRYTIANWQNILVTAHGEVQQCFNDVADGHYVQGGQTLFEFTQLLSQTGQSLTDARSRV